jgi:hypothetical protein
VTSIDQIKEKAVKDAYLRMYKLLYQCGKVRAYIFRQNTQVSGENLNSSNCTTAANGKFFNKFF